MKYWSVIGLLVFGVLVFCICCYKVRMLINISSSLHQKFGIPKYFMIIKYFISNYSSEPIIMFNIQVTNLLYQLFTIDNQDPDMVSSLFRQFQLLSCELSQNVTNCKFTDLTDQSQPPPKMYWLVSTLTGVIRRAGGHTEGHFEPTGADGEVDAKTDR